MKIALSAFLQLVPVLTSGELLSNGIETDTQLHVDLNPSNGVLLFDPSH